MNKFVILVVLLISSMVAGCGGGFEVITDPLPPVGTPPTPADNWLIVDRAVVQVVQLPDGSYAIRTIPHKLFNLIIPMVHAYEGSTPPSATLTTITYNNPASTVGFTISQATTVGSYVGDILSFGHFAVSGLDDNQLKKCPASGESGAGNQKCTEAAIRIYSSTGNLGGSSGTFCNTNDDYCVPLMVDGVSVGVGVANAAYTQTLDIPNNKNRLRHTDFTSAKTNFPTTMDMSNAGAGTYSATLIVEYVLRRP